jgi:hypothetical protein
VKKPPPPNGDDDLFSWKSDDHFGSREDGQKAAFEATCLAWREAYYTEADRQKASGLTVTSQTVTAVVGRPPGHPSRIAATQGGWAKSRKLKPTGTEKSDDRHQGHHHTW